MAVAVVVHVAGALRSCFRGVAQLDRVLFRGRRRSGLGLHVGVLGLLTGNR